MEAHWCDELVNLLNGSAVANVLLLENASPLADRALGMLGYNTSSIAQRTIGLLADVVTLLLATEQPLECECQSIASELGECKQVECSCKQHVVTQEAVVHGSNASGRFLQQVMQACQNIVENGHGLSILQLIEALLKAFTDRCSFKRITPASCSLYVLESDDGATSGIVHFLDVMVQHSVYSSLSSSSRLHAWRLHPMLLKQDISGVVLEATGHPQCLFLHKELHERPQWKKLVVCLATCPLAFVEARRLLHNWIAYGGVWYVLSEIVDAVKSVLVQPMDWGFTQESAAAFPSFHTLYPSTHRQVLRVLAGPFTDSGLDELVSMLDRLESMEDFSFRVPWNHHDSFWSLLMDFPQWYFVALRTLFGSKATAAAVKYVTYILHPLDRASRQAFFDKASGAADNWQRIRSTMACSSSPTSQGPSSKRLRTDGQAGEDLLREIKLWLANILEGQENSVLVSIFCLGPVLAESGVLDEEAGRLLVEMVAMQSRDMFQSGSDQPSSSVREPKHRTECYSRVTSFLFGCSRRLQECESNGIDKCIVAFTEC